MMMGLGYYEVRGFISILQALFVVMLISVSARGDRRASYIGERSRSDRESRVCSGFGVSE